MTPWWAEMTIHGVRAGWAVVGTVGAFASGAMAALSQTEAAGPWSPVIQLGALGVLAVAIWAFAGKFFPMLMQAHKEEREAFLAHIERVQQSHADHMTEQNEAHREVMREISKSLDGVARAVNDHDMAVVAILRDVAEYRNDLRDEERR